MSFFLSQFSNANEEIDSERMKVAEIQFDAMASTFNTYVCPPRLGNQRNEAGNQASQQQQPKNNANTPAE